MWVVCACFGAWFVCVLCSFCGRVVVGCARVVLKRQKAVVEHSQLRSSAVGLVCRRQRSADAAGCQRLLLLPLRERASERAKKEKNKNPTTRQKRQLDKPSGQSKPLEEYLFNKQGVRTAPYYYYKPQKQTTSQRLCFGGNLQPNLPPKNV